VSHFELITLFFVFVILWLGWREVPATCRKPTKAKVWSLFVAALVAGAGLGSGIAYLALAPVLARFALQGIARIENQELLAASISTSGLLRLEEGKTDEAKALLATNIAHFYSLITSDPPPKNRDELVAAIEVTAKKSPILRQKIAEEIASQRGSPSP
jgi:hypothetical protein